MIEEVFTAFGDVETRQREEALDKLAIETFAHYKLHEHIQLLCPHVLVRVLPRDMWIGHIYIPDTKDSNKPVYEGIVLHTWLPKMIPSSKGLMHEIRSELEPMDHVLFPHFAGQPIPGLNEERYRTVPEAITRQGRFIFGNDVGAIFAKINYRRESVEERFDRILIPSLDDSAKSVLLRQIRDNFDISVKMKGSITKSGV